MAKKKPDMFDALSINGMFEILKSDRGTRAVLVVVTADNEMMYLGVAGGEKTNDPGKISDLLHSAAHTLSQFKK